MLILSIVRFYPGATTEEITYHLRSAMRKKLGAIILHAGTNDLMNDVNNAKFIEKVKGGVDIQVGFSEITERKNHYLVEKIKDINERA